MSDKPPPILYKLRSLASAESREFLRQTITEDRIFFPAVSSFNDPFDSIPVMATPKTRVGMERLMARAMHETPNPTGHDPKAMARSLVTAGDLYVQSALQESARNVVEELGVFCLTAQPANVLMWSHYADSHQGVALGFRADRGSPFHFAQKIHYEVERPVVKTSRRTNDILQALTTKADFWAYEDEWRTFKMPDFQVGPVHLSNDILVQIILGPRMRPGDAEQVIAWNAGRRNPAEILRATIDPKVFRLHIEPESARQG